ncbi:MAG: hypothetical protein ACYC9Q_12700 [Bacillota bacterium]
MLQSTERLLNRLTERARAGRLKQREKIGEALGRIKHRYHVGKHLTASLRMGTSPTSGRIRRFAGKPLWRYQ